MTNKRYIQILNSPLEYNGEKCTAYQVENAVHLQLNNHEKVNEFYKLIEDHFLKKEKNVC